MANEIEGKRIIKEDETLEKDVSSESLNNESLVNKEEPKNAEEKMNPESVMTELLSEESKEEIKNKPESEKEEKDVESENIMKKLVNELDKAKKESIEEVKIESEKTESEVKKAKAVSKDDSDDFSLDDIFITEKNTFDVSLKLQKFNKKIISDIHDNFDYKKPSQEIKMTFKYPSQGDSLTIQDRAGKMDFSNGIDMNDLMKAQLSRLIVLSRSWTLNKKCTPDNILTLDIDVIKGIMVKIYDEIQLEGII